MNVEKKFYSLQEIAKILSFNPKTTFRHYQQGKLKGIKVGRQIRISEKNFQNYLNVWPDKKLLTNKKNPYLAKTVFTSPIPQNGFYVHYKSDLTHMPYDHMYEVVGIGRNTEEKTYTVLYRPLYENTFMPPANFQSRPLEMFLENAEVNGVSVPRFKLVADENLIKELEEVKRRMYP